MYMYMYKAMVSIHVTMYIVAMFVWISVHVFIPCQSCGANWFPNVFCYIDVHCTLNSFNKFY